MAGALGHSNGWYSECPQTGAAVPFAQHDGEVLEAMHLAQYCDVRLLVNGARVTVDLSNMQQTSQNGELRRVFRIPPVGTPGSVLPTPPHLWLSFDPLDGAAVPYPRAEARQLEAAFQTPGFGGPVVLQIGGAAFAVDVQAMVQISAHGGSRPVARLPESEPSWRGAANPGGGGGGDDVAAPQPSAPPLGYSWESVDPRTGAVVPYSSSHAQQIEQAFQDPAMPQVQVVIHGLPFTVDPAKGQQISANGSRTVRRVPPVLPRWRAAPAVPSSSAGGGHSAGGSPSVPHGGGGGGGSGRGGSRFDESPDAPPLGRQVAMKAREEARSKWERALDAIEAVDRAVAQVVAKPLDAAAVRNFAQAAQPAAPLVLEIYTSILEELDAPGVRQRYGGGAQDSALCRSHCVGQPVPQYYANVKGCESIFRRKVLSVLGLRNLVEAGPRLYADLQASTFCSTSRALPAMRQLTGTVVDLDSVVLRCDQQTLDLLNRGLREQGKQGVASVASMRSAPEVRSAAVVQAQQVLMAFCADVGLHGAAEQAARRVHLPEDVSGVNVPVAHDNSERGHSPVWFYERNATFHANAPDFKEVVGSLLRAPWHAAKAFCMLHTMFSGADLVKWKEKFFEDCISDSCFNGKWKSIEIFVEDVAADFTIEKRLAVLEQEVQGEVDKLDDEADDYYAQLGKLLAEEARRRRLRGVDAAGKMVDVDEAHVRKHVARYEAAGL